MKIIDFSTARSDGNLPEIWIHGSNKRKKLKDPLIQVHKYNEHTIILRQSKDVSFEAPFIYLLFGNDRALLVDTGATAGSKKFPLRRIIDNLVTDWLTLSPRENYQLIICHTHGHNDHTAGDEQFSGRKNTIIVQKDIESIKTFFKIQTWPNDQVTYDLGGRRLEIIPTPGHDSREISIFDYWTKILITGDLICPGRLYINDIHAFAVTINKLLNFSIHNEIRFLLGCHIEMKTSSGKDYPVTAKYQPNEHPLQLGVDELKTIKRLLPVISNRNGVYRSDNFMIWVGPCIIPGLKQLLSGFFYNIKNKVGLLRT